jgi:ABC-type nitrate/sulfonate/bicarbonate transport system permease component
MAALVWEVYIRLNPELSIFLPSPTEVVAACLDLLRTGTLQSDIYASLKRVTIGLYPVS